MSKWKYKGRTVHRRPKGKFGFIYVITHNQSGLKYIGMKQFHSTRRIKVAGKVRRKVVTKESDWKTYNSSSKTLQDMIKTMGESEFSYEIICYADTKGQMTYLEENFQHKCDAILNDNFLNDSIGHRRYMSLKRTQSLFDSVENLKKWIFNYFVNLMD